MLLNDFPETVNTPSVIRTAANARTGGTPCTRIGVTNALRGFSCRTCIHFDSVPSVDQLGLLTEVSALLWSDRVGEEVTIARSSTDPWFAEWALMKHEDPS